MPLVAAFLSLPFVQLIASPRSRDWQVAHSTVICDGDLVLRQSRNAVQTLAWKAPQVVEQHSEFRIRVDGSLRSAMVFTEFARVAAADLHNLDAAAVHDSYEMPSSPVVTRELLKGGAYWILGEHYHHTCGQPITNVGACSAQPQQCFGRFAPTGRSLFCEIHDGYRVLTGPLGLQVEIFIVVLIQHSSLESRQSARSRRPRDASASARNGVGKRKEPRVSKRQRSRRTLRLPRRQVAASPR